MTEQRKEFATMRRKLLRETGSKEFICARCGTMSKSNHIHHIKELIDGGENDVKNMIPLCGDCHLEWDLCADVGMSFGEFLVSLSNKAWQIATKAGLLKAPTLSGEMFSTVYQLQFTTAAIKCANKYEDVLRYFDEMERQNKIFSAYPYSDHKKMLQLYGDAYITIDDEKEYNRYVQKIVESSNPTPTA